MPELPKAEEMFPDESQSLPKAEDVFPDDDTLKDMGKHVWNQVNPLNLLKNPLPAINAMPKAIGDSFQKSYEAAKGGDYLTALRHLVMAGSPDEPTADLYQQGKPMAATGDLIGQGINLVAPTLVGKGIDALKPSMESGAESLYQRALKPGGSLANRKNAVRGGLNQGLPVEAESLEPLTDRAKALAADVASDIPKGQVIPGSTGRAIKAGREVEANYSFPNQAGDQLPAVVAARDQFLSNLSKGPGQAVRDMTADEMQAFKQGAYDRIRSKLGYEPSTPGDEWSASVAKSFKDDLNTNFPQLKGKLDEQGQIAELYKDIQKAVGREGNKNPLGYGAIGGSVGGSVGTVLGGVPGAVAGAGLGGGIGVAIKIAQSPAIMSRIALWLHHASEGSLNPVVAKAQAAGYLNQLASDATERNKQEQSVQAGP